ncbi:MULTISPECIES: flagellar protein FlaG [Metabacillus]|uniref:Flagellar protein FlaG n=1 Tax=Metabacillus rhizolycopersici TaxID=2875709 RepID=A0ABS7UV90_9BACI|nr:MULTISPECIES: flagellar protein FlaG [Metabacillus]MBZ5752149.1 flagellar protein FlaG [Metabacillus rhizolycopersici]MCM3654441.1 flagellar protein FlaG [Metabacillus litoralis]
MTPISIDLLSSQTALHNIETTKITSHKELTEPTHTNRQQPIQEKQSTLSKEQIMRAIDEMNEGLKPANRHIKFELHEKLNEYYVTVVDNITNEVVRENLSKKWLDLYADMTEFVGLFVDKKS